MKIYSLKVIAFVMLICTLLFLGCISTLSTVAPTEVMSSSTSDSTVKNVFHQGSATPQPTPTINPVSLATITPSATPVLDAAIVPTMTPPSGLVYTSADGTLWQVGADGESQRIAAAPAVAYPPVVRLSPDHRLVLYDDSLSCWVIDISSGEVEKVAGAPHSHVSCQWSLDDQKIYYADGMDVWVVGARDRSAKRNLTGTPERFEERLLPLWPGRPDTLLFYSWPLDETPDGVGWTGALTTVHADGTQYQIVADTLSVDLPALSPDGQILAYIAGHTLWLYQWSEGIQQVDLPAYNPEAREVQFTSPTWSPDGAQIAGWAGGSREGRSFYGIMALDLQTNTSRILEPLYHPTFWDGHPPAPEWSPDGQWLIYWGQDEAAGHLGFHVVSADGQQMHTLAFESDDEKSCANPWAVGKWAWSPDGRWLAFTRCEGREGTEYIKHGIFLTEVGQWNVFQTGLPQDAEPVGWINDQVYAGYETFLQAGPLEECWENAMTQPAMNQCAVLQEEQSYLKLTQFLEEAVFQAAFTAEHRASLADVQTKWEVFRQKDCEWVFDLYGKGTIGPMNYRLCQDAHNRQRLQQLLSTFIAWTGRSLQR